MSHPSGYLLLNESGRIVHASTEVGKLLGLDAETLVGRDIDAYLRVDRGCDCGPPSGLVGDRPRAHDVRGPEPRQTPLWMHVRPLLGEARRWLMELSPSTPGAPDSPALLQALTTCPALHWALVDDGMRVLRASCALESRLGQEGTLTGDDLSNVLVLPGGAHPSPCAACPGETFLLQAQSAGASTDCGAPQSHWSAVAHPTPLGTLLYLQEVTEAFELRRELTSARRFTAEMLTNAPDAICIVSPEAVLFENRALETLLGKIATPAELDERVRPVSGRSLQWYALGRPEEDWLVPVECVADEGDERRELHVYLRPLTFEGQPAILYAMRDFTSERKLERQLLRSQKLETLGHIAVSVSHDFGNLLTLAAFDAERARNACITERQREPLDALARTTERAQRLVREVMGFTRDGSPDSPVDLSRTVRELQPILERAVGERRRLSFDVSEGPMVAPLAAIHVEQILLNLLLNARDATPEGGAIEVTVREAAPGIAEIQVRDFGVGMGPAVVARVFEPFFTTKRESQGAGMGLAVVRDVVQRAGGHVRIESEPGAGTLFIAELPIALTAETSAPARGPVHGTEKVAVCYWDEELCEAMTRSLRLLGYDARNCHGCPARCAEATAKVDAWVIDEQQLEKLARDPLPGERAVLCITASPSGTLRAERHQSLRVNVLAKPFTPVELALALRATLD